MKGTVADLVSEAFEALGNLGEECREAQGNFPNQSHPKAEAFGEAADVLCGLSQPHLGDLPEAAQEAEVESSHSVPTDRRKSLGRARQRDNACQVIRDCAEALRKWAEDHGDEPDVDAEALESAAGELDDRADEADGVEFPGMYG